MKAKINLSSVALVLMALWLPWLTGCAPLVPAAQTPHGHALNLASSVYYETHGSGQPTLVLIHCWSGHGGFWREQVKGLADRFRLVVVDLPGHGRSEKPDDVDYSLPYLAGGVLAAMDDAGVNRAVLVGHSLGLAVARQVALLAPDRVSGLVSVDGYVVPAARHKALRRMWEEQMSALVEALENDQDGQVTRQFVESMFRDCTPESVRQEVVTALTATPLYVRLSAMEEAADPAMWTDQPVNVPTLAVYAQNGSMPPNLEEILRDRFPNLTYRDMGTVGHFFMFYQARELNQLIADFAAGLR